MATQAIFITGAMLFALATVYFWFAVSEKDFNAPVLVTAVTTLSYILLVDGGLAVGADVAIHWTRWVGYMISCPLIFYTIATGAPLRKRFFYAATAGVVMASGAVGAALGGWLMWASFAFGSVVYVLLLMSLYQVSEPDQLRSVEHYIWFGWSMFPVVFVLAPAGVSVIGATTAAAVYLILDLYTKVIFYQDVLDLHLK